MRSVRVLAALALTVVAALTVTPVNAAPGDGTLSITMVDEQGDPMPGALTVIDGTGGFADGRQAVSAVTLEVAPGAYGVVVITPWGGMQCVGIDPCDYFGVGSGTATPSGDLVVTAGQVTSVAITGAKPVALGGTGRVGAPLTVEFSEGMQTMMDYLGGVGGGSLSPTVSWLRDGEPIAGETEDTYRPVGADVGKSISARIAYTGLALAQFQQLTGTPVTPRATNAVKVAKVPTKAFAILSNPVVKPGNKGKVRVEVTAKNLIVTGKALITVGDWSQTRALRNGTARVIIPKLAPGKHVVEVRYLGTSVYDASTAQPRTLTVSN